MKRKKTNTLFKCCALCLLTFSAVEANGQKGTITILDKTYATDTIRHLSVGPGTVYTHINIPDIPLNVFFLKIDSKNPHIAFETVLSYDSIMGNETTSRMAIRKSSPGHTLFAGTNADFYDTGTMKGMPINGSAIDGQVAKKPSDSRPLMGFDAMDVPVMDILNYEMSVSVNGVKTIIDEVNYPRYENKLVLYNQYNGKTTRTNNYGSEAELRPLGKWDINKPVQCEVVQVYPKKGTNPIRNGYAYLSGHGTKESIVNGLKQGDIVEINYAFAGKFNGDNKNWQSLFGGDRVMVRNGQIQENDWAENHPRTGIGMTQDSTQVIMCVVDGRSSASAGVTTKRLGDIMRSAGAYNAMNMDGGGSSTMYIKEMNVVNNTSDVTERAVANGVYAVSSAPEDNQVSTLSFLERNLQVIPGSIIRPTILSYNQYGTLLSYDFKDVKYSCSKDIGYIDEDGAFVATHPNTKGVIEADYNGVKAYTNVDVLESFESFNLDLNSVLLDGRKDYEVNAFGQYKGTNYELSTSVFEWEIKDPTICSINSGVVSPLKNGTTQMIARLGNLTDTLNVIVEIAPQGMTHEDFSDVSSFTLTSTSNITTKSFELDQNGAALNFIFKRGRASSLALAKLSTLYSKPDTIKLLFHSGESVYSKVAMKFKVQNSLSSVFVNKDGIIPNSEQEIVIDVMKDIVAGADPDKVFPIQLEGLTFFLKDASMTSDVSYSIGLKNITLAYKDVALSSDNIEILSKIKVYPNPVTGKVMYMSLSTDQSTKVSAILYNIQGQSVRQFQFGEIQDEEKRLDMSNLADGFYLLKIQIGDKSETVKVQIKN